MPSPAPLRMLEPFSSPALRLKNRIVLAPMTRLRANEDGTANALMTEYYRQRATAGLVVTESVYISEEGRGSLTMPGIGTQAQMESWRPMTAAVRAEGAVSFLQLYHAGRTGHSDFTGGTPPVAPSPLAAPGKAYTRHGMAPFQTPRQLAPADIARIVSEYAQAARNALAAGFDGVELHAANGYLPSQFLAEATNHRTDAYGGTDQNRARFVLEVVAALAEAVGAEKVGVRLSPLNTTLGAVHDDPLPTYTYLIRELDRFGLAYLHLVESFAPDALPPHHPREVAATFRPLYAGTLIASTGLTKEKAEALLASGTADLVAFGAAFISNPDLPERFRRGVALRPPDRTTYYSGDERGYIDYPKI